MTLRFILEYARKDQHDESGYVLREMFTVDAEVPELEAQLRRGGYGPGYFEKVTLGGVEVLEATKEES